jgi:hypothetical protein
VCNLVGPLAGTCTQCSAAEHGACVAPDSKCQLANGACVACLTNDDCSATPATPLCNEHGQCAGCETDNDCNGASPACQPSGACGQCSAIDAAACAEGTTCEVPAGRCVPIGADGGTGTPPPADGGTVTTPPPIDGGTGAPPTHADGGAGAGPAGPDAGIAADQPPLAADKDTVAGGGLSCAIGAQPRPGADDHGAIWSVLIACAILIANRRRIS